jgi:hypothetical protein
MRAEDCCIEAEGAVPARRAAGSRWSSESGAFVVEMDPFVERGIGTSASAASAFFVETVYGPLPAFT